MMTRLLSFLVLFAAVPAGLWAIDLRYPPNPSQREEVLVMGWPEARDAIAPALLGSYLPGIAGRSGSTGMTGYRQWLTLYKWARLLARAEQEEAIDLLQRHLFLKPCSDQPTLILPGDAPSLEMTALPRDRAMEFYSNDLQRAELLGKILPPNIPNPSDQPIAERLDGALLRSWIEDPAFSEMFLTALSVDDYLPGVLWNLQEIALAEPEDFKRYPSLALAIALVYDIRLPDNWPHHQVSPSSVPKAEVSPAALFAQWVAADKDHSLLTKLQELPPGKLKFVVDAPLSESEFTWARKNARFPRSNFDRAFSSIEYDFDRLKTEQYTWPGGDYSLEEIQKRGGICVDQAYFAMVAGKARGLPTLYFRGQGADGGHAWFGYLKSADRWEMDAGRYENQNYAMGEALDPQNWRPISDHQLKELTEGFRDKPQFIASQDDLLIARLAEESGDTDLAAKAFRSAVEVCPQNPEAWARRGEFLARAGVPADERRAYHEAALKQFANQRDLRVTHQMALAEIAREMGDAEAAEAIEKKIVSQNRRLRSDLSVNAAARHLAALVDEGRLDDAFSEYRKMLRSLKETGGGNFFYDIVRPFTEVLAEDGDSKRALEAADIARKALRPDKDSILAREFDRLASTLKGEES
jgi:tetratricopeptide (TPR) repeat protein